MQKTYVLDTNVLIQAPQALRSFENNEVVIPLVVLEELDLHKKDAGEVGASVRAAIRLLEEIRQGGDLLTGAPTPEGGNVRVEKNCVDVPLPKDLPEHKSDNRILKVCLGLQANAAPGHPVILVTKDILLRIKAQIVGVMAQDYTTEQVSRKNSQFDDGIGYLPGDEQEKIAPLMRPILDNLEQLVDSNEEERYKNESELQGKVEEIFDRGIIQAEALNFIRGRSIVNTWLIIDEAQNMTPLQAKGIITRAERGTKVILLGDPNQIDRPYLDEQTNGLSYASEHMKGSPLCWQVTMDPTECERSALALDASMRL